MRFVTVLILLISGVPALAGPDPALEPVLAAAMKGTAIPGMGVAVIRDGKLASVAVHGNRDTGGAGALRLDDEWQIGSDTKPMTATLIVRLVEQHRLSLDAPLSATMPDLAAKARPDYRVITLREMLHHTTGLPHDVADLSRIATFVHDTRPLPDQRKAYLAEALKAAPVSPPGKEVHYSNTGYLLAAAIAERAAGTPYEALMEREIFSPLQMTSARLGLPRANRGHLQNRIATAEDEIPPMMNPAGGVTVTLADWAKFCVDQIDGSKGHGRLLTAEGYRLLQTPDPTTGNGLGWGVDATFMDRQGPMLSHTGTDGSWYSMAILFPASGSGMLVNANAGSDMGGEKADKAVLKALLPGLAPPVKK
jgi:CubicO group peptidase (beta-lactamase class C family)